MKNFQSYFKTKIHQCFEYSWKKYANFNSKNTNFKKASFLLLGVFGSSTLYYSFLSKKDESQEQEANNKKGLIPSFLDQGIEKPPSINYTGCLLKEFIIPMPFSFDEYFKGAKRYCYAKKCFEETNGRDGIEVIVEKNYIDPSTGLKGIFSEKIYHLDGYFPSWLKRLLPLSALYLIEKSWDFYPFCITKISSPFFTRLEFIIQSIHFDKDRGTSQNVFQLSDADKLRCNTEILDILSSSFKDKKFYHSQEDVSLLQSKQLTRPLKTSNWSQTVSPVMCCYKLVSLKFDYFGIQQLTEEYIMNLERDLILRFHKQVYAWQEEWLHLTPKELDEKEKFFNEQAEQRIAQVLQYKKKRKVVENP